jgi:hypothetical protein
MFTHTCIIDCVPTPDGRHILYPAQPFARGGWDGGTLDPTVTRRQYRATGRDETRECRVWAAERSERLESERDFCHACNRITRWADELCLSCGREWGYDSDPAADAARLELYYSGRERTADNGRGL